MTKGAVRAPQRNPATKVWVFQWPKGALDRRRLPFRQRPRRRVIFVVVPVSSRKTSLCGSSRIPGCRSVRHSSRAWRVSGRSHSLARSVFFKAIAVANKPARDGGGVGPRAALRFKLARQFGHRNVVLLRPPPQQKNAMRIELGVPASAKPLGRETASPPLRRHQVDDKRWRNVEMRRSGAPREAAIDKGHNALPKVLRISSRHRKSPPTGSESHSHPRWNLEGYVRSRAHGLGVAEGDLT